MCVAIRRVAKASSAVLILCSGSLIGAKQHNYKAMTEEAGGAAYTYTASKWTASDLAAGLTGTVIVKFRGCNTEDTCAAIASLVSSPNTTIVLFSRKNGVIGLFLSTDAVGYVVKGPTGEQRASAVVPTEAGSVLLQIKQDALGFKLQEFKGQP
jgi:hypothetical protein